MHRNDILSLASLLVGIASLATDSAFSGALSSLLPGNAAKIALAVLGILGMVASQVIRVYSVPADTGAKTAAAVTASLAPSAFLAGKAPTP